MSDLSGTVIEEPKNNPAAHRVWELVSLFMQAQIAWDGLVSGIAEGYSKAWYAQKKLLKGTEAEIEADRERQAFILSIFVAGIAGGLLGGVIGGVFEVGGVLGTQKAIDVVAAMGDDAASQFGGTALAYFQQNLAKSTFESPGIEPSSYEAGMHKNVAAFFLDLHATIRQAILDLQAGKIPASEGERWYQYFSNAPFIKKIPGAQDVDRDFEAEASLCLWIAWGSERDFAYWDRVWKAVLSGKDVSGIANYYDDIYTWDRILDVIANIDPTLVTFVTRTAPGLWQLYARPRPSLHLDVRKLMYMGVYSKIESARAMSNYFLVPNRAMGKPSARKVLATAFGRGSEFLRAGQ